jgi:hypothetical protein
MLAQKFHQIRARSLVLLDECDSIANAKTVLEEQATADAQEFTLAHNSNAISQDISLIHIVSS